MSSDRSSEISEEGVCNGETESLGGVRGEVGCERNGRDSSEDDRVEFGGTGV